MTEIQNEKKRETFRKIRRDKMKKERQTENDRETYRNEKRDIIVMLCQSTLYIF